MKNPNKKHQKYNNHICFSCKINTKIDKLTTIPSEIIYKVVLNPNTLLATNPTHSLPVPQAIFIIAPI